MAYFMIRYIWLFQKPIVVACNVLFWVVAVFYLYQSIRNFKNFSSISFFITFMLICLIAINIVAPVILEGTSDSGRLILPVQPRIYLVVLSSFSLKGGEDLGLDHLTLNSSRMQ